jgi:hypothetical protein
MLIRSRKLFDTRRCSWKRWFKGVIEPFITSVSRMAFLETKLTHRFISMCNRLLVRGLATPGSFGGKKSSELCKEITVSEREIFYGERKQDLLVARFQK